MYKRQLLFIVPIYCGPAFGQNQERSFDEIVSSWKNFVGTVETNQFIDAKAGALSEVGVDTTEDTKILLLPYDGRDFGGRDSPSSRKRNPKVRT